MIDLDPNDLVQALDTDARADLERAAGHCVARNGSRILVEDLLLAMLERPDSLLARALQDAQVDREAALATLQPVDWDQASGTPVFAPELLQWLQDGLLTASVELGRAGIDQAALVLALLRHPRHHVETRYQSLLTRLNAERIRDHALALKPGSSAPAPTTGRESSMLARFTHDLTEQARQGQLDPVLCREEAIAQMIDILSRRRKNNPIVVGEAGVGKTAVVEGLAIRIANGEIPPTLQGARLLALDIGLLEAGASIKGEFERRLKGVIDEIKRASSPTLLFIDEAHTLIGAGGQAGGADAANLLKPALARGEVRTIAATTWSEYARYFEKDPALARRFQPVRLQAPSVEETITLLRGLAQAYESSHGVYLRDDAVVAAAELSARYLTGRELPDKAVDVLDTACARVRIGLASAPVPLERLRTELAATERLCQSLLRDRRMGVAIIPQVLDAATARLDALRERETELRSQWTKQRELAAGLLELRQTIMGTQGLEDSPGERLEGAIEILRDAQSEQCLASFEVCPRLVAEVVSQWTGIPLSQLLHEYSARVGGFAEQLRQRIRGQEQAVQALDRAIRASAAGLGKPDAPTGVFLLVGPSGVGKTETAIALADLLYGGSGFLTVINMAEFQEKHSIARLIGAPPGYVGYGEGGMLTEAVRRKPYSVILLDEVEKADPEVLNLFYQIFDKGLANDSEGREIDFRNTLILMTSNLASDIITRLCTQGQRPEPSVLEDAIRPALRQHFQPALLARMRVAPYYPVDGEVLHELVALKLSRLGDRLRHRDLSFDHSEALVQHLADLCQNADSGARLIDTLLERSLIPPIANRLLQAKAGGESLSRVHASIDGDDRVTCEFE